MAHRRRARVHRIPGRPRRAVCKRARPCDPRRRRGHRPTSSPRRSRPAKRTSASAMPAITRNLFAGFDVALAIAPPLDLAWAVSPSLRTLARRRRPFPRRRARGRRARAPRRALLRPAAAPRCRSTPPPSGSAWRASCRATSAWFEEAAASAGVDWRVLAAVAYQESQWDPAATSETGVRGFMQITEDTAQRLRHRPPRSVRRRSMAPRATSRRSRRRLPARIAEPDRTLFALAAYNIGAGHLEDARVVAQRMKLNPDRWDDVRQALPLLALPEHYENAATAMRAAACRSRSSTACARITTCSCIKAPHPAPPARSSPKSAESRKHASRRMRAWRHWRCALARASFSSPRRAIARADAPRVGLPRRPDLARARRAHPRRRDDRPHPDRRHRAERRRTWRSASTTSRARVLAGAHRARARQRARRAGDRVRARRQRQPADRAHALSGHDHRAAPTSIASCSKRRRAASSSRASATSCSSATPATTRRTTQAVAAALEPANGRRAGARARGRRVLPRGDGVVRRCARRPGLHATPRSAPHAGLADTSLMLAVDPALVRSDLLQAGADGVTGDPRRATAALGTAARRRHRAAQAVRGHPAAAAAR